MTDRTHTAHRFTRLVSEAGDGRCVFACSANPHCVETEIRHRGAPSPFAQKQAAAAAKKEASRV